MERILEGKIAVITGTSRGIGAEIAKALAEVGVGIVGNHVDPNKNKRADRVIKEVEQMGGHMESVLADITTRSGQDILLGEAKDFALYHGEDGELIDYLILNAAGGLEEGKPDGWAEKINIDAQMALVDEFTPYLREEGAVIYVTSLWAHRYGELRQLPFYRPVARTKYLAEQKLRQQIPQSEGNGLRLGILCGHVITDTGAYSLLSRAFPERMAEIKKTAEGGEFPSARDMGVALRKMLIEGFNSGDTVYVGGTNAEKIDPQILAPYSLDRTGVSERLPMYGGDKLLIDGFDSPADEVLGKGKERGVGRYKVRLSDTDGHFANEWNEIRLFRGVDQIEAAAQAVGLTFLGLEPQSEFIPFFRGVGRVQFKQMVFPGDEISLYVELTSMTAGGVRGNCDIKVGSSITTSISGIDLGLASNKEVALRLINKQRSSRQIEV